MSSSSLIAPQSVGVQDAVVQRLHTRLRTVVQKGSPKLISLEPELEDRTYCTWAWLKHASLRKRM